MKTIVAIICILSFAFSAKASVDEFKLSLMYLNRNSNQPVMLDQWMSLDKLQKNGINIDQLIEFAYETNINFVVAHVDNYKKIVRDVQLSNVLAYKNGNGNTIFSFKKYYRITNNSGNALCWKWDPFFSSSEINLGAGHFLLRDFYIFIPSRGELTLNLRAKDYKDLFVSHLVKVTESLHLN